MKIIKIFIIIIGVFLLFTEVFSEGLESDINAEAVDLVDYSEDVYTQLDGYALEYEAETESTFAELQTPNQPRGLKLDDYYLQFDDFNKHFQPETVVYPSTLLIATGTPAPEEALGVPKRSVQEKAGSEILQLLNRKKFLKDGYTEASWNAAAAENIKREEEKVLGAPKVKVKLPFDSQLSITGRKMVGMTFESTTYDKPKDGVRSNTSSFDMEQELQMRIQGSVSDRLDINVDFDDTADKKDISVVYKGHEGEFVQEAAFGDISVALPSTEFLSYSKELFGLKVDTQFKGLKTSGFFSKTKGMSEVKKFTGNTQMEKRTIADTSYIRLQYYSILNPSAPTKAIRSGSARVFVDKARINPNDNIIISTNTVITQTLKGLVPAYNFRGNFTELRQGTDYIINYNTGVISFTNSLLKSYTVAIDYQYTDGTWLSSGTGTADLAGVKVIKDANDTADITTELKTFYSFGNVKIIRDDGRGNFLLKVLDLNDAAPSVINPGGKPVPQYPPVSGGAANITVDFDNGVFNLEPASGTPMHDDLYTINTHRYNFVTEYSYRVKIINLRADIVPKSEQVKMDGVTIKAGTDYYLDYDAGILTILNEDLIKEDTVIEVAYDYSPFGSAMGSTLFGLSSHLDLLDDKLRFGGSFLYDFQAKESVLPDVSNTPQSLFVGEIDASLKDYEIAEGLTVSAYAEQAMSSQNRNMSDKATIDSMNDTLLETPVSMIDENWFASSTPGKYLRNLPDLTWRNYDLSLKEIDPRIEIIDGERIQVMDFNYNLNNGEVSAAQIISEAGYDFSKKLYVELWIKGDGKGSEIFIDYATAINEDSDGNNILGTEDTTGKGFISPWEDIGRPFYNLNSTISRIGAHNGLLDTEDLNGNALLDTYENIARTVGAGTDSTGVTYTMTDEDGDTHTNVNWYGWKKFKIPLNIDPNTEIQKFQTIRLVRVTLKNTGSESGTVTVGKLSVVGNSWDALDPATTHVSSVGLEDPNYVSLIHTEAYRNLYDIDSDAKKNERSLSIAYSSGTFTGTEAMAERTFMGSKIDISFYEKLRMFVFNASGSSDVFVFRAGANDENYFEYRKQLTPEDKGKWMLVTIKQKGSGAGAYWTTDDPGATITPLPAGSKPNLQRIAIMQAGLVVSDSAKAGEVWVSEIHVIGTKNRDGSAAKYSVDLKWNGTTFVKPVTFGASRKTIDKDFQTVTASVFNRDYVEDNAYFTFEGFDAGGTAVLPVRAKLSKVKTVVENVVEDESGLISLLEEGRVLTYSGLAETTVKLGDNYPVVTASYGRDIIDTSDIERLEDRNTTYATLVYNNPVEFPLLPYNISGNYKLTRSYFKVYPDKPVQDSDTFLDLGTAMKLMDINDYHTLETNQTWNVKMPFKYKDNVLFTPAYLLTTVREKNHDFGEEIEYDKNANQDIGATLGLKLASWFKPHFLYNINTREVYDVTYSTVTINSTVPGEKKYIERSGNAEVSWNFNAYDLAKTDYLKSFIFTANYRMQDIDSYKNVDKNFDATAISFENLWIRDNLLLDILPSYSTSSYNVNSAVYRDIVRLNGTYNPFEAFKFKGMLSPLNTLSANFTYSETNENAYNTGTKSDIYTKTWPELLIGITRFERFFGEVKWMSNSQLNFRHHTRTIDTLGFSLSEDIMYGADYRFKIINKFDIFTAYETTNSDEFSYTTNSPITTGNITKMALQAATDLAKWRLSLRYENETNSVENSRGELTSDVNKDSWLFQVTADLSFPNGIKIPFINTVVPLTNRFIFLSNARYVKSESSVNITDDNSITYGIGANADYEISKYFRASLGFDYARYEFIVNPDENYTNLSMVSKITIQF
jgi:hypothetical protein